MPMWRCPHCGTPQAETSRCWVCRRSSTACGTCRNFRHSVAGSLGYCGLDGGRQPLVGDEIRPCWEAGAATAGATVTDPLTIPSAEPTCRVERPIEFVEVPEPSADDAAAIGELPAVPPGAGPIPPAAEPGWNLWGDLDR